MESTQHYRKEGKMTYDLKPINVPRLTGHQLRMFVKLLEKPFISKILVHKIFRDFRFESFQKMFLEEVPLFQPYLAPEKCPTKTEADRSLSLLEYKESKQVPSGFAFKTVQDFAQAYRKKLTTPEEIGQWILKSIRKSNEFFPPLRAMIAWDVGDIIDQAHKSAQRFLNGRPLSIFDGVPIAVKDEVDQVPYGTTLGTRFLGKDPAVQDATVVSRLRAAGALLIGKTNMHEIGIGITGFNTQYGTPWNPYGLEHYTGGSSSGSAVAVAIGLCPVATGSDSGGSIRIPASFCGVVGLKPTWGRVSEFRTFPSCWSVAHTGLIAGTVRDVAMTYTLIAGPDPMDRCTKGQPAVNLIGFEDTNLKGVRLGIYEPWFTDADSEVVTKCEQAIRELEKRGAQTKEIVLPELDAARIAHAITISSEMATAMKPHFAQHQFDFGLDVRANLAFARHFTSIDYIKAQQIRARTMAQFHKVFEKVDAIATPTTACTAPPRLPDIMPQGESDIGLLTQIMKHSTVANLIGIPAISLPAGYDSQGLPIGIQFMGRHWEENLILRIAYSLEETVTKKAPYVYYSFTEMARL